MRTTFGLTRRTFQLFGVAAMAMGVGSAKAQSASRVVVVIDPADAETNRAWATSGFFDLDAAFQRLIGNDANTGEYDNSALAERWESNENFTVWTFYLKSAAMWHFGWGKVTAEDVAHSYKIQTGADSRATGVGVLRGAEVEIVNPLTIRFKFKTPRVDFSFANAGRGSMYIYSKAQFDAEGLAGYDRKPAGTGPYEFLSRNAGQVNMKRVDNHWSGARPDFAELQLRLTAEPATKLALLLSGEAHIAVLPRELQGDAVGRGMKIIASQTPSKQVVIIPNGNYNMTGDAASKPGLPWSDIRVRKAMNHALNRQEIITALYDGRADMLVRYGMHAPHEGFVPQLVERFKTEYRYDPAESKVLLEAAGYPSAFSDPVIPIVSTVSPGSPEYPTLAEMVQSYFAEVGLQTKIVEMDWASLGALGRGRKAYVVSPVQNAPIRPSSVALFNTFTPKGSPYHGYEDDKIVGIIEEIQKTTDGKKREALIKEAFTYTFDQHTDLPLVSLRADVAASPLVVADWIFPGVTSNGLSHWHLIKAAK